MAAQAELEAQAEALALERIMLVAAVVGEEMVVTAA